MAKFKELTAWILWSCGLQGPQQVVVGLLRFCPAIDWVILLLGKELQRQDGSSERPFYINIYIFFFVALEQAECRNQETGENTHCHIHAIMFALVMV